MSVKGTYFGNYLLLAKLAKGGMAQVCVGKSFGAEGFERLVAIKQLLPEFSKDEKFVSMFIDEAKIASQLSHANICQIYDLGNKDGTLYIAMEFIHGRDMYTILKRAAAQKELVPTTIAAAAIAKIADALDYAHRKKNEHGQLLGIVHRDISPQNILISFEGDVKLIDFGIAKARDRVAKTQAGIIKGKFFYMSPEQITDGELDGRTDIFALGAVLYELLTGVPAFKGATDGDTVRNVATSHYLPVNHYNPRCPKSLCNIVDKALARNKDERYQRAAEMSADLQRYLLNEAMPVSGQDFSDYMRSLFASEWQEEQSKIQYFKSVKAPSAEEADEDIESLDKTVIAPNFDVNASLNKAKSAAKSSKPAESDIQNMATVIIPGGVSNSGTGNRMAPVVSANQLLRQPGRPPSGVMPRPDYRDPAYSSQLSAVPTYITGQTAVPQIKRNTFPIKLILLLIFVVLLLLTGLTFVFMPELFGLGETMPSPPDTPAVTTPATPPPPSAEPQASEPAAPEKETGAPKAADKAPGKQPPKRQAAKKKK